VPRRDKLITLVNVPSTYTDSYTFVLSLSLSLSPSTSQVQSEDIELMLDLLEAGANPNQV
jgi:hypothetical protein